MSKVLLSCDLNCCRITEQQYYNMLDSIRAELSLSDELVIHLYNYIDRKHTFVTDNVNTVTYPYNGSHKRVTLDLVQALDTATYPLSVDCKTVFVLAGDYDSEYLYAKLLSMGIAVYKILLSASQIDIILLNNESSSNTCKITDQPSQPTLNNRAISDTSKPDKAISNNINAKTSGDNYKDIKKTKKSANISAAGMLDNTDRISLSVPEISASNTLSDREKLKIIAKYILDKKAAI